MTDKDKVFRYDMLHFIRQRIGACFGQMDGVFAEHPADEKEAKDLRDRALKAGLTLQEVLEIAFGYLYSRGFNQGHIHEQIEEVKRFFSKKIH